MRPILLIVPFNRMLGIAIQATQNMLNVQIECALLNDAIPIALEAESKGTQVVISHTRFHQRHHFTELFRSSMSLCAYGQGFQRSKSFLGNQQSRWKITLMDGHIGILAVFDKPFVRLRITAIDEFHTIPFKNETH